MGQTQLPFADPLHGAAVRADRRRHHEISLQVIANLGTMVISCLVSTLLVLVVIGYSAHYFQRQRRIISQPNEAEEGK